jgi:lysophospholipase L1-like esterase
MLLRTGFVIALVVSTLTGAEKKSFSFVALGDSIAFGYDPALQGSSASSFTGYPEVVIGDSRKLKKFTTLANLACPGESSGSFLDATKPDFHCREYKAALGLHVPYQGTQMSEALFYLTTDSNVGLVTINIGGNDLVLLQLACNFQAACILNGLPAVLAQYGQNLAAILATLRTAGNYTGTIVLLTQYSPDYRDPLQTGAVSALNSVAIEVASYFGVVIADGFGAFQKWAAKKKTGGDTCAAGLLVLMPSGGCDVHPSSRGQRILAEAIDDVL